MRRAYVAIVDLRLGPLPQRCLVTVAANLVLPGAGYGEHRQTMWLTRVHPDAAIEIDRWMANWIPPATGELAQVGWDVPPAER